MIRRARSVAVLALLISGALGIISSTQTWLVVVLDQGAHRELPVPGASALPVLAPLSLAVLALAGALSVVGRVLRYVFGVLAVGIAVALVGPTWHVLSTAPVSAVAATVTETTGIAGESAVRDLVSGISTTAWPTVAFACWILLAAAGVFVLVTAHAWPRSGRRYRTDDGRAVAQGRATSRPHDAIDSWDELSHGDDPTDR